MLLQPAADFDFRAAYRLSDGNVPGSPESAFRQLVTWLLAVSFCLTCYTYFPHSKTISFCVYLTLHVQPGQFQVWGWPVLLLLTQPAPGVNRRFQDILMKVEQAEARIWDCCAGRVPASHEHLHACLDPYI